MNQLPESIFKITAILLISHGIENFIALYAQLHATRQGEAIAAPLLIYYSQLMPILIGTLVWLLSQSLAKNFISTGEPISAQSAVSVGCFLLGVYFIGANLPSFIFSYAQYEQLSGSGAVGDSFAKNEIFALQLLSAKLAVGIAFILSSVKLSKIYMAIRRAGA
jgi:hypothetical protein